jgi:hypothetical protein
MYKKPEREGTDLLLYNQHRERVATMESTMKTTQGRIQCYDTFYRSCILRCRRIEKDNIEILERLARIAENTHLDSTLRAYVERRINAGEKPRSCSF